MTEISPTFDPSDNTWFTDDGVTAKSLAELQAKLPGAVLEGYCPEGYGSVVKPRPPEVAKVTLPEATNIQRPKSSKKPSQGKWTQEKRAREAFAFPRMNWSEENKARLQALVDSGLTSAKIAAEMRCSQNAVIGACYRYGYQLKFYEQK